MKQPTDVHWDARIMSRRERLLCWSSLSFQHLGREIIPGGCAKVTSSERRDSLLVMITGRLSKLVAFVAILALTTFGAFTTASAQSADIKAVDKVFQDHYARGNYSAAQIEAQELERLAKVRFGADHADYAIALNKLALVYWKQGKYSEAEAGRKAAHLAALNVLAVAKQHLGSLDKVPRTG